MTRTAPLVRVHNLGIQFQGQTVLQDISFEIAPGEIITVIGPNGAGKTTLIRAVLGLQRPDTGSLERRAGLRIGYMPQKLFIDPRSEEHTSELQSRPHLVCRLLL